MVNKAKSYLTANERQEVAVGFIANESFSRLISYATPLEKKALLKIMEWWDKYTRALFQRVGQNEGDKIIREFTGGEIIIKRNSKFRSQHELNFNAEDVHDLAGPIIETHCRACKKTGHDCVECRIHAIFTAAKVPTINDVIPIPVKIYDVWEENSKVYKKRKDGYEGLCPYRYEG